jgi:hypothetical protein
MSALLRSAAVAGGQYGGFQPNGRSGPRSNTFLPGTYRRELLVFTSWTSRNSGLRRNPLGPPSETVRSPNRSIWRGNTGGGLPSDALPWAAGPFPQIDKKHPRRLANIRFDCLHVSNLTPRVVHLKPETESRLNELSATTGRAPDELVEDAMAGYWVELAQIPGTLDARYDESKSGRVKPVDGEEAFNRIRTKSKSRRS